MIINRNFWLGLLRESLESRSIAWLAGVRRVGKTVLCSSIPDSEYFDCELPRVRKYFEDEEAFFRSLKKEKIIILDEIHRLDNPSQVLKIAADHFPGLKIIATGSSSLSTSKKFRDTLTGRKHNIRLTPLNTYDIKDFNINDTGMRLLRGGLPPFILSSAFPEKEFQEWMDSFWAKDVQELFSVGKKASFMKFVELLFLQSGGMFEATKFSRPCEVSRVTIQNYLNILEQTFIASAIKPFSTYKPNEITYAPKVYAFDTGFVCYYRGWDKLRNEDHGLLWEHFVLNELMSLLQDFRINYWRDKQRHEIDFILQFHGKPPITIECRWKSEQLNLKSLIRFRELYPEGLNAVVAEDITRPMEKEKNGLKIHYLGLKDLAGWLKEKGLMRNITCSKGAHH
ncbi:MAG: ATP-binding protein [Nitrospinae bacterium]|nr:ATP-binding protein [Nitrospinota bacterium]